MNDKEIAATEQLAEIERARQAVGAKAAKEYTPFIGWGLFVLLMIPPFDVVAGKVWGPVILLVGLVGTIATFAYFIRGHRRVRIAETNPWWWWLAWALWYCALLFGASVLQDRLPVAWTAVGVASALPLLVVGIRLRRRATV